jgi:acetyl esterase/lipase
MPSAAFKKVLQLLAAMPVQEGLSLEEMRALYEKNVRPAVFPLAKGVSCEPVKIGHLSAEWLTPAGFVDGPTMLYLHGGGYFEGSLNTHRGLVSQISLAAQARSLLIDYRLAPENPFPAAVEDAAQAYMWLTSEMAKPAGIIIGGDSAGGGLTVAALLDLKASELALPAGAVCMSPWMDLKVTGQSVKDRAHQDPLVQEDILFRAAEAYLNGQDPENPLASPLYGDLAGLPPIYIQTGTAEVLLDDSKRFAERAKQANVDITLELWEDMIHVWHVFYSLLPESREAIQSLARFIREKTGFER